MKPPRLARLLWIATLALPVLCSRTQAQDAGTRHAYATLRVTDEYGAPLPCTVVETLNHIRFTSDDHGVIAFYEPGLMGQDLLLQASRAGYEFEYEGHFRLTPQEGGEYILQGTRNGSEPAGLCAAGTDESFLVAHGVPTQAELVDIQVLDAETGRPVPLMELSSPKQTYATDSQGHIAFFDPELMNQTVSFEVRGHGYLLAGSNGSEIDLRTQPGTRVEVLVTRDANNIAERLYRLTGAGIDRDSILLGLPVALQNPLLNAGVMGQDGSQTTLYNGKVFWAWGDTGLTYSGVGNMRCSAALSSLPGQGGLQADVGVDLSYFTVNGVSKWMMPEESVPNPGPGFHQAWLEGPFVIKDAQGRERLYGFYKLIQSGNREEGLVAFDDAASEFVKVFAYSTADVVRPHGSASIVHEAGGDYIHFSNQVRIRATESAVRDPASYEAFSPYVPATTTLEIDPAGKVAFAWKTDTLGFEVLSVRDPWSDEMLPPQNDRDQNGEILTDPTSGGSTEWNEYRGRFVRTLPKRASDELWIAEADAPEGPWVYARKVLKFGDYGLYNPRHHPFLDQDGGRAIFFDVTYSNTYVAVEAAPRYEYNQLMFKVQLDDDRLALPVPVYAIRGAQGHMELVTKGGLRRDMMAPSAPFFAFDRAAVGTIPVFRDAAGCRSRGRLRVGGHGAGEPSFYALPVDVSPVPAESLALYEFVDASGTYRYDVVDALAGFTRSVSPVARVFRNPIAGLVDLPVIDYLAPLLADAGSDQCPVETAPGAGSDVTLDGHGSSRLRGQIVRYEWHVPQGSQTVVFEGEHPQVHLAAGVHSIALTVTDSEGKSSTDTVLVDVAHVAEFNSRSLEDGYVRESTEASNTGAYAYVTTFERYGLRVGDDAQDRQTVSVLSFDTAPLPDDAVLEEAQLRLTWGETRGDPSSLGSLLVDVTRGSFSGSSALQRSDFEASATLVGAANLSSSESPQFSSTISTAALSAIHKQGRTQARLRFARDDDDDGRTDDLRFEAGEGRAQNVPRLRVVYR